LQNWGGKHRSFNDPTIKEEFMRKFALLAALAGALFTTAVAAPNRADAMTISNPAGVLDAVATIDEVAKPEQVRWCGWRGCWGWGYWRPRAYYYGYYRPWPYYGYYPSYYYPYYGYGWGWRRWWW
jgi:hypothetical protein